MTPVALLEACRAAPWRGGPNDATVYAADLDRVEPAAAWLDRHERARAARFVTPELQRRNAAARTLLRALLAAATGTEPAQIAIVLDANGKPRLADGGASVHFNLSHCATQVCIALGGAALGVDVESRAALRDPAAIAASVLGPAELAAWNDAPEPARRERLLRAWVAKEAVLKASGEGLVLDPRAVLVPDSGAGEVRLERDSRVFRVYPLTPRGDCIAALASTAGTLTLRELTLSPTAWR